MIFNRKMQTFAIFNFRDFYIFLRSRLSIPRHLLSNFLEKKIATSQLFPPATFSKEKYIITWKTQNIFVTRTYPGGPVNLEGVLNMRQSRCPWVPTPGPGFGSTTMVDGIGYDYADRPRGAHKTSQ